GVEGTGRDGVMGFEAGEVAGSREPVGEERRRGGLAVAVVAGPLPQRLADALGESSVNLAGGDQWVDDGAAVVDLDDSIEPYVAGVGVDLDDAPVRAERGGQTGRLEDRLGFERRLDA